tara:strand:+ start:504 stop:1223 length:720 start_codon:yes stop_codon:yes gene_type:complete
MDRSQQNERAIDSGRDDSKAHREEIGFVKLVNQTGGAVEIVNAARVSFGKRIDKIEEKDLKLIRYLWKNKHTSPFRHIHFTFHIKAPIFVLRQWMKHQIGCSWNEISGRYVQFDYEFFCPEEWRTRPLDSIKQGSGDAFYNDECEIISRRYIRVVNQCHNLYQELIDLGVCKEQARMILPLSLYSECYWTVSFQALLHFLDLRLDSHSQVEIQDYAKKVQSILFKLDGIKEIMEEINEI